MKTLIVTAVSVAALFTSSLPTFAQAAAVPAGAGGTAPIGNTGAGPDSASTGFSQSGRGGTGGAGGVLSNGTSDGAGTATGGNSGGNPQSNGGS